MHDDEDDHSHFDFSDDSEMEDIEGIEKFTLHSVGIDIGSSTTHTIFSRLILRREGAGLSAKFVVTNRDVLYRSPIMLTPYITGTEIDTDTVKSFIEKSYEEAGFSPDDIDTGAVVITGEALKKENAQPILEYFSEESGRFICASAGPMHEALLAAFGSGAVSTSKHHDNSVLDVDLGGGTTKFSLITGGHVRQMVAIEVGARLIAYDDVSVVHNPHHLLAAHPSARGRGPIREVRGDQPRRSLPIADHAHAVLRYSMRRTASSTPRRPARSSRARGVSPRWVARYGRGISSPTCRRGTSWSHSGGAERADT